jgi:hypothetical protein
MIYTILTLLLLASWYMIFKLFIKVEKQEEAILTKTDDILFLQYQFTTLLEKMQEIDRKKMFETDDEVGETFGMLKTAVEDAKELILKIEKEDGSSNR